MPELPEVETIVTSLRPRLCGRSIVSLEVGDRPLRRRWHPGWTRLLPRSRIVQIHRRGKWIVVELSRDRCLLIHLGMTGQLCVVPAKQPREPHTHVVFRLKPGREELRFRDVRRFGSVTLLAAEALEPFFVQSRLGPEPFDLEGSYWFGRLRSTRRCLKAVLLDQQVVAGVGNIYADEALFEAGLSPARRGDQITLAEADRLRRAIVTVLRRAIKRRGSSIRDFIDGTGNAGDYQREFRVYGRTGEPCPRCRTPIRQVRLAGRSTHFCPVCQRSGERGRTARSSDASSDAGGTPALRRR